jgi:hypothetical protein
LAASMSAGRIHFDERLDEWGSRLFNVPRDTPTRPRRSKRMPLGSAKPVSASERLSMRQARATSVQQTLQAMVRHAPPVVVKVVRVPITIKALPNPLGKSK